MNVKRWSAVLLLFAALLTVFLTIEFQIGKEPEDTGDKLVIVSPHPTEFMIPLIHEFENETGISTELIKSGTGPAIEKITGDPDIDVLWGGSILSVGPYADSFYQYNTLNKVTFKNEYSDVADSMTCFSDVPSVIMINEDILGDTVIEGYGDLLQESLKGKIAFASPEKSSSSFEHLVNMLYVMGGGEPDNGWGYVKELLEQLDGNLLESSSEVYQGVANGKYVAGLTFEEAAVTMLKNDKHIRIIYMNEGVVSTPDGIYINKNSERIDNAKRFVDFMTSKDAQNFMAKNLGRRSVRKDVEPSDMVISYDAVNSIAVDRDRVIENKDNWIRRFMEICGEVSCE